MEHLLAALRTLGGEVEGEVGDIVETQSFALPGVLRGRAEGDWFGVGGAGWGLLRLVPVVSQIF